MEHFLRSSGREEQLDAEPPENSTRATGSRTSWRRWGTSVSTAVPRGLCSVSQELRCSRCASDTESSPMTACPMAMTTKPRTDTAISPLSSATKSMHAIGRR